MQTDGDNTLMAALEGERPWKGTIASHSVGQPSTNFQVHSKIEIRADKDSRPLPRTAGREKPEQQERRMRTNIPASLLRFFSGPSFSFVMCFMSTRPDPALVTLCDGKTRSQ